LSFIFRDIRLGSRKWRGKRGFPSQTTIDRGTKLMATDNKQTDPVIVEHHD